MWQGEVLKYKMCIRDAIRDAGSVSLSFLPSLEFMASYPSYTSMTSRITSTIIDTKASFHLPLLEVALARNDNRAGTGRVESYPFP